MNSFRNGNLTLELCKDIENSAGQWNGNAEEMIHSFGIIFQIFLMISSIYAFSRLVKQLDGTGTVQMPQQGQGDRKAE